MSTKNNKLEAVRNSKLKKKSPCEKENSLYQFQSLHLEHRHKYVELWSTTKYKKYLLRYN